MSYLTGRIQRVVIEDAVSGDQEIGFGVPQGSVLGPKIYCMYTNPVSDIIQRHGLSHHSYADDTQLYVTMDHSNNNWQDGLARIQLCVSEIWEWMNQNMLKLNDDKTELVVFTSKYKQDVYNDLSITIGDTVVDCSSQVKDLGVIFDRVLSLHISYTSKTCRFHLRNISRIRKYIPQLVVPYVLRRVLRSAELNLLTVPPGKPGKYGSRSFARASANQWNSLRGERAAWVKNSPTLESFKINLKTFLFWERFSS